MRLNKPQIILTSIFALAIFQSSSFAQSGSRAAISSVTPSAPIQSVLGQAAAPFQGGIQGGVGQFQGGIQGGLGQNVIQGAMNSGLGQSVLGGQGIPFQNSPVISQGFGMGQSVVSSPYSSVVGSTNMLPSSSFNSNVYNPTTIGDIGQSGCSCCNLSPSQIGGYQLQPVTNCCGKLGKLGVPPLTTPLRYDTPPIGRAVGRPLFGKWNGF